ncbi:MAG: hypothetical protein WC565_10510 [Parcubacteria group bacterium]
MLYATNGRVQELPEGTQFSFWDKQVDLGRAWKIAKVELYFRAGKVKAAALEMEVSKLIDRIYSDPCKTFVSRPQGQSVDWQQWGRFCHWYMGFVARMYSEDWRVAYDADKDMESLGVDMDSGSCGRWLGQFLLAVQEGKANSPALPCYSSQEQVDMILFWDMFDFSIYEQDVDKYNIKPSGELICKCKRPDWMPGWVDTSPILASREALLKYTEIRAELGMASLSWSDLWKLSKKEVEDFIAQNEGKRVMKLTSSVSSAPMHDPPILDEMEPSAADDRGTSWGPILFAGGAALFLTYLLTRK